MGDFSILYNNSARRTIILLGNSNRMLENLCNQIRIRESIVLIGLRNDICREGSSNFTREGSREFLLIFLNTKFCTYISTNLPSRGSKGITIKNRERKNKSLRILTTKLNSPKKDRLLWIFLISKELRPISLGKNGINDNEDDLIPFLELSFLYNGLPT